jgi:hypothetical protein
MNPTLNALAAIAAAWPLALQEPANGSPKSHAGASDAHARKDDAPNGNATFGAPVRLKAGDKFLGGGRLYPSPVFRDMNKDGVADLVVGDLIGKITIALRNSGADPLAFAAETDLNAADGNPINFHNW